MLFQGLDILVCRHLALVEVLKAQGCMIVPTPEEADAVVLNTCTVIGPTVISTEASMASVVTEGAVDCTSTGTTAGDVDKRRHQ